VRILVTGGAGYVGSFTARHLLERNHEVVVLDDLSRGHREAVPDDVLVVGEIADRPSVTRLLEERRIEAVVHFAAESLVGESIRDPRRYYRNNVTATLALLETLLDCGVPRLVFSSTCAVYGETEHTPLTEETPLAPANPYAFTKLVIERMIGDLARAHGLGHVILRYFNAAGGSADGTHGEDHRPETHLIPLVLGSPLSGEPLEVFGDDYATPDGTCIRDYVHVEDLAVAHELALGACPGPGDAERGRIYNVGTGIGHSVLDVIGAAERVTGAAVPYRVTARRPGDAPRLVADPSRLQNDLGWKPAYTHLDQLVTTAWAWHESHPNGYGGSGSG
jgi:UDP-glucose-4-epimerase GalE